MLLVAVATSGYNKTQNLKDAWRKKSRDLQDCTCMLFPSKKGSAEFGFPSGLRNCKRRSFRETAGGRFGVNCEMTLWRKRVREHKKRDGVSGEILFIREVMIVFVLRCLAAWGPPLALSL